MNYPAACGGYRNETQMIGTANGGEPSPVGAVKKTAKEFFFDVSNLNRAFDCLIKKAGIFVPGFF